MSSEKKRTEKRSSKGKKEQFTEVSYYSNRSGRSLPSDSSRNRKTSSDLIKDEKPISRKLPKYRLIINILASLLCVLLVMAGAVFIVIYTYFHRINYQELEPAQQETSAQSKSPQQTSRQTSTHEVSAYEGELLNDPGILNIMLFGEDTRKNADVGNSDTMILFSIDTRHKKLKMLSLLRDTYVDIPGYGENRLNAAYTYGGASLTVNTIQKNYGIKIDRYAVVDFNSFKKIIDTLGGIDVEMTSEEVDYINWQSWINEQDEYRNAEGEYKESVRASLRSVWITTIPESEKPINKDTLTFTAKSPDAEPTALVHLNGKQALWHARNRGEDDICSGDDYVRTERQRNVVSIIIDRMKNADISTTLSVIYEIGPMITTNIKTSEITSLASNLSAYLKYDIVSSSAPKVDEMGTIYYFSGGSHPIYINGYEASVILIYDWNVFRQEIAEFVFEEQVRQTSH